MLLLTILVWNSAALAVPTDHVVLIDNSTATGQVDAERRLRDNLAAFIRALPSGDRLALVLYQDLATPLAPLTRVADGRRTALIDTLNALSFNSNLTNPAAGLERAIYELSSQRRPDAKSRILMIQAGRLRTGNREQDASFQAWADKVLIDRAAQHGIRVDVVSLGAEADQDFGLRLAERTGGRHLKAAAINQLNSVFLALETAQNTAPASSSLLVSTADGVALVEEPRARPTGSYRELEEHWATQAYGVTYSSADAEIDRLNRFAAPGAGSDAVDHPATSAASTGSTVNAPVRRPGVEKQETAAPMLASIGLQLDDRQLLATGLAAALLIAIGGGLYHARRRRRGRNTTRAARQPNDGSNEVRLADLHGASGKPVYVLTGRLARICRNAGQDTFNVVCITIPDDVISREHAFIECREGKYWLTDPGSNNGTFVNGKRVRGSRVLHDGDRLRFATFEFLFQDELESAETMIAGSNTQEAPAVDPMKTQVAPRPLALVSEPEDPTLVSTVVYRPTANEDPNLPVRKIVNPTP